jgi:hypothetical protein
MGTNYPQTVEKWLNVLYDEFKKNKFFEEHNLNPNSEITISNYRDIIGSLTLESWLKNGDVDITLKKISEKMFEVVMKTTLEELKNEGIVDYIQNSDGEEIIWLTKKYKEN